MQVTLEQLLEAGAHFGHQTRRWNPKMAPYIYASHNGVHIFDLTKTKPLIEEALGFLTKAASDISHNLKKGQLVILESSVAPKTTRNILYPILASGSGLKGSDFFLAFFLTSDG